MNSERHHRTPSPTASSGRTGPDYDELLDAVAAVCAADDLRAIAELYEHDDLKVPAELVC